METEVAEILTNSTNSVEEVVVYEVIAEYQAQPDVGRLLKHYPHIFVQLCDGNIIDADMLSFIDIDFLCQLKNLVLFTEA